MARRAVKLATVPEGDDPTLTAYDSGIESTMGRIPPEGQLCPSHPKSRHQWRKPFKRPHPCSCLRQSARTNLPARQSRPVLVDFGTTETFDKTSPVSSNSTRAIRRNRCLRSRQSQIFGHPPTRRCLGFANSWLFFSGYRFRLRAPRFGGLEPVEACVASVGGSLHPSYGLRKPAPHKCLILVEAFWFHPSWLCLPF